MKETKRLLALILAVTIIASMFIGAMPVSAAHETRYEQDFNGADYATENLVVIPSSAESVAGTSVDGHIPMAFNEKSNDYPVFIPFVGSGLYTNKTTNALIRYVYADGDVLGFKATEALTNGGEGIGLKNPWAGAEKNYKINIAVRYKQYTAYAYMKLDGSFNWNGDSNTNQQWFPNGGTKRADLSSIVEKAWKRHTYEFLYDSATSRYTVNWYVDGIIKGTMNNVTKFATNYIFYIVSPWSTTDATKWGNEILFDDFYISEISDDLKATPNITNGEQNVPLSKDFTFKFSGDVSSDASMANIRLKKGNVEVNTGIDKKYDAKTNTVTASVTGLDMNTEYTWDLSELTDVTGAKLAEDKDSFSFKTIKDMTYVKEDFATDVVLNGEQKYTGNNGSLSIYQNVANTADDYVEVKDGTVHYRYKNDNMTANSRQAKLHYDPTQALGVGKYRMEFDIKSYTNFALMIYDGRKSWSSAYLSTLATTSPNYPAFDNEWHKIAIDIDNCETSASADIYVDGGFVRTVNNSTEGSRTWNGKLGRIEIQMTTYKDDNSSKVNTDAYFDNLVIKSIPVDLELKATSLTGKNDNLPLEPKLSFDFSDSISSNARIPIVKLKGAEDAIETAPTASFKGTEGRLIVDFSGCELAKGETYTIDLSNVESIEGHKLTGNTQYEFTIGTDDSFNVSETLLDGGAAKQNGESYTGAALSIEAKFTNKGYKKEFTYIVARYKDNALYDLYPVDVAIPGDGEAHVLPLDIPAADKGCSLKILAWQDGLTPLKAPFELKAQQ